MTRAVRVDHPVLLDILKYITPEQWKEILNKYTLHYCSEYDELIEEMIEEVEAEMINNGDKPEGYSLLKEIEALGDKE